MKKYLSEQVFTLGFLLQSLLVFSAMGMTMGDSELARKSKQPRQSCSLVCSLSFFFLNLLDHAFLSEFEHKASSKHGYGKIMG